MVGCAERPRPDDARNVYKVGQNTTRLLMACGDLVIGWLLLRQAEVALAALDAGATGRDQAFYEGKVAAAPFFARAGAAGARRAPGGRRGGGQRADGAARGSVLARSGELLPDLTECGVVCLGRTTC